MSQKLTTTVQIVGAGRAMQGLPAAWRQQFAEIGTGLIGAAEKRETATRTLAAAREMTPSKSKALYEEHLQAVERIDRDIVKVLDGRAEAEAHAALVRSRPTGEAAVIAELRRGEIRSALKALDPIVLRAKYVAACRDGSDDELVDAVELAPAVCRLVPPDVAAAGREAKIERLCPLAGQLRVFSDSIRALTNVARQELGAVGGPYVIEAR